MGMIHLVRHGQASFGHADYDRLQETGIEQSVLVGQALALAGVRPTLLVRGMMRRHRETLEALAQGAGWEHDLRTEEDPGWNEVDHLGIVRDFADGPVAVADSRAFQTAYEGALDRWMGTDQVPDGIETWPGFSRRVRTALTRAVAAAGPGQQVVVVSSAGPIAISCAAVMAGQGYRDPARRWRAWNRVMLNASVTRMVVGRSGARLLSFNEHQHLTGEHLTYR